MPIKYSRMVQQSMGMSSGTSADRPENPTVGEQFVNGTLGITEVYTENDGWQPLTSSSTGIPYGTTADRPANPELGQPFFNADEARLELYTSATGWQNIVQETPSVVSISGIYAEGNASNTITVNGTNFAAGAIAYAIGTDGVEIQADTTTLVSVVEISATFSGLVPANEPYDIKVVNPSNLYGVLYETLQIDDIPVFITQSGTLGTYIEESPMSVQISATDDENSPLIFSITSGSLPTGLSLNTSTGEISGTPTDVIPNTTYSFDISATDGNNTASRSFSITINDRGPTWSTSQTLLAFIKNSAYSGTLIATDDNLQPISYSLVSGSLPAGLTLSTVSNEARISGTPTSDATAIFTIRATDTNSGAFSDRQFTIPNVAPIWAAEDQIEIIQGAQISKQLSATDDSTITYSLVSGSLPTGITLSTSGLLSGTTTDALGSSTIVLAASDTSNIVEKTFTIIVASEIQSVFAFFDFANDSLNFSTTLSSSESTAFEGLDGEIDSSTGNLYGAYNTLHYVSGGYPWSDATRTQPTNDGGLTSNGRGIAIGSPDGVNALIYVGHSSNGILQVHNYPDMEYIAEYDLNSYTSLAGTDVAGIAWDGQYLHVTTRSDSIISVITAPDGSTPPSEVRTYNIPSGHNLQYGMNHTGQNLIMSTQDPNTAAIEFNESGNILKTFDVGVANYSVYIDYANRRLHMGGYNNNTIYTFNEL